MKSRSLAKSSETDAPRTPVQVVAISLPAWKRRLGAVLVFAASIAIMLRPTWSSLNHSVPNLGDPVLIIWFFEWGRHALFSDPLHLFDANIFWPHTLTFAYSENMLAGAVLTAPVRWLGGSWALAWNTYVIANLALCLGATYSLVRYLIGRTDTAIFAALAFTFGAFTMSHLAHAQLLCLGLFPLGILLLFRTISERRYWLAIATGATSALFVFTSMYFAAIWAVVAGVLVVGYLVLVRFRPGPGLTGPLISIGLVAGFLVMPVALPYLRLQQEQGQSRGLVPEWGLKAKDLITSAPGSISEGPLAKWSSKSPTPWEHAVYPGLIVIAFALVGVPALAVKLRRRGFVQPIDEHRSYSEREPALLTSTPTREGLVFLVAVAGLVSFVIAAGPTVLGLEFTPFRLLYELAPGFNGIRVAARLVVPGLLALVVMAGYGYSAATMSVTPRTRVVLAVVVSTLVLVELGVSVPRIKIPDDQSVLAVYHALDSKQPGAVAELPISPPIDGAQWSQLESSRMLYSSIDWNPRFNGYSGYWPDGYPEDAAILNTFPSNEAWDLAHALEIRYVILHLGDFSYWPQLTQTEAQLKVDGAVAKGAVAVRYGDAWLIDIGNDSTTSGPVIQPTNTRTDAARQRAELA